MKYTIAEFLSLIPERRTRQLALKHNRAFGTGEIQTTDFEHAMKGAFTWQDYAAVPPRTDHFQFWEDVTNRYKHLKPSIKQLP
jgi:hypothetical protein